MKKFLSILLITFLSLGTAWAGGEKGGGKGKRGRKKHKRHMAAKKSTSVRKLDDTTTIVIKPEILMDEVDSLLMFPSHDLYGSWDTSVIHPYNFDSGFINDSTAVYLLDDWNCGFTCPFKGMVTSEFGWRRRRPHFGTDVNLETGDSVVAAFDGRVRIARLNRSYGNVVIIRHNNGLETVYAHLSKILVEPGQEITSGTLIGLGGNTGRSYGSHLHFEIRYLGKPIDPMDIIDFEKGEVKNGVFVLYKQDFDAKYDLRHIHNHKHSKSYITSKEQIEESQTRYYVIKKGDTLDKIARRHKTTVALLCKKNGLKKTKALRLGQRIKV